MKRRISIFCVCAIATMSILGCLSLELKSDYSDTKRVNKVSLSLNRDSKDFKTNKDAYIEEQDIKVRRSSDTRTKKIEGKSNALYLSEYTPSVYKDRVFSTTPKNQGQLSTCWGFSTIAAIESNLIKKGIENNSIDLSEAGLIYFTYNKASNSTKDTIKNISGQSYLDKGGNKTMTMYALASGTCLVDEAVLPYSGLNTNTQYDESYGYDSDYIVRDVGLIQANDKEGIKEAVYTYGAVSAALYHFDSDIYYNSQNASYHQDVTTESNHAVTIIGWDDNYSKNNFNVKPSSNGAWLVKNSWGTSWGDDGYYWVSYEDKSLNYSKVDVAYFNMEKKNSDFLNIYEHDGTYALASIENVRYHSNIFTSKENEALSDVLFYTNEDDISYEIKIYTGVNENPTDGQLVHTQLGDITHAGCHTIKLDKVINVKKGTKYSVVIKLSTADGGTTSASLDCSTSQPSDIEYNAVAYKGESFYKMDGGSWVDTAEQFDANCRIKVFTQKSKTIQGCDGNHKWHGEIKNDKEINCSYIQMSCRNENCSYIGDKSPSITVYDYYNYVHIDYDNNWKEAGLAEAKISYERIWPIKESITSIVPVEAGDYKVRISIEDVVCDKTLKLVTSCGNSVYKNPYGSVVGFLDRIDSMLGIRQEHRKILSTNTDGYDGALNVKNLGSSADTTEKKQIIDKLKNGQKAIFCDMDIYACGVVVDESIADKIDARSVSRYFDFSKMVSIEDTQEEIEVYISASELLLDKGDLSNSNLKVLRNHNGKIEVLDSKIYTENYSIFSDSAKETRISFKTDKFSDNTVYALVYGGKQDDTSCFCTLLKQVNGKKATCTEDGIKTHYICTECNKKYEDAYGKKELQDSDIIIKSAKGVHKEVVIPGYDATCYSKGLTDGKKCSECGDIIEAQKTIEKTDHVLLYIPEEAATYTQDGHKAYYECYCCRGMFADWYGKVETNYNLIKINKLQVGATKSIKEKTRKSSYITFTWNKVSGASGYRIYVSKNGKWVQLESSTTATSYTAKKLSAGTNYKFAVKAYKKVNGKAVWSNSYKSVTLKTLPGKTSKISSKSAGKGKVTLSWNKVKGASGYRLYYKQGKKWVTLMSSMSGNKIKVTGLNVGKKYTFAVKAYVKENGKTIWSDVYTSKTVTGPKK